MTMIERVARAIDDCLDNPSPRLTKGMTDNEVRAVITDQLARAAIEAMREPTEEMEDAVWLRSESRSTMVDAWRAAIDAALAEEV